MLAGPLSLPPGAPAVSGGRQHSCLRGWIPAAYPISLRSIAPSSHHRLCVGASDLSPPVSHKDGTCVPLCTVEGLPQWSRLLLQIRNLRSLKIDCLESGKREGRGGVEPGSLTPGLSHHPVLESDGHVCTCGPCLLMSHTNHPSLCPILDTKQIQGYQDLSLSSRIYPLIWKEKA